MTFTPRPRAPTAEGAYKNAKAIEVYVYRIRKKLEPLGCEIRTVRGMGYLMERIGGPD